MKICNLIAFAGGVVAGGIMALMFAPKKGTELRKDIKERLCDMKRRMDCCNDGTCGEECHCGEENVNITVKE